MKIIAMVYFSGSGHTALMAEAVQRGASAVDVSEAVLLPICRPSITGKPTASTSSIPFSA